ncbi:hypothetical protein EBB07_00685 [Paenibacillaceae bacterium]|nr:hypothetical protein EBB07_00685 [Paenibacillaceae bacterium]
MIKEQEFENKLHALSCTTHLPNNQLYNVLFVIANKRGNEFVFSEDNVWKVIAKDYALQIYEDQANQLHIINQFMQFSENDNEGMKHLLAELGDSQILIPE